MKILSVFHQDNEISLHTNMIGKKSVYYNGHLMASKWSCFKTQLQFTVMEEGESITYTAGFAYNSHGQYQGDLWRNYQPLVISSSNGACRPKRPLEHVGSDFV